MNLPKNEINPKSSSRFGCQTLKQLLELKAQREGNSVSKAKLKLAITRKDGREELTLKEINEITKNF